MSHEALFMDSIVKKIQSVKSLLANKLIKIDDPHFLMKQFIFNLLNR